MQDEFKWIRNLQNLEILSLYGMGTLCRGSLSHASIKEFINPLSNGLHSLQKLEIKSDLFNSTQMFLWSQFFPNLNKLTIDSCKNITNEFIAELTVLNSLSNLCLINLKLKDIAFTANCINKYSNTSNSDSLLLLSPAIIACFKSLRQLEINCCPFLTNNCIINGIAKCKTLEKLVIYKCTKMNEKCLRFVINCDIDYCDYWKLKVIRKNDSCNVVKVIFIQMWF